MSDPIGRLIPGLDPVTGMLALPLWAVGAIAALFVVFCMLAFARAGREGMVGGLARLTLVLVGAVVTWLALDATSHQSRNAERLALDARAHELAGRATAPGSALACLDAIAGDTVEGHCEKALFATPQAMAAAVSYVSAQLALLAAASDFVNRGNPGYEPLVARLRRALETDRYGLVAHVLATQEGCTAQECGSFALLTETDRIGANLAARAYDAYVQRHATVWPAIAPPPVAGVPAPPSLASVPSLPSAAAAYAAPQVVGPNVFFPSSDSIPAVSIMTTEPADGETTGAAAPAAKRTPAPPKRPTQAAPPPQSAPPPMDLNAARGGTQ